MLSDATAATAINAMNRYFFSLCILSLFLSFVWFTSIVYNVPVRTGLTEDTWIFRMYGFNPDKNSYGTRSDFDSVRGVWMEDRCHHHVKTLLGSGDNSGCV